MKVSAIITIEEMLPQDAEMLLEVLKGRMQAGPGGRVPKGPPGPSGELEELKGRVAELALENEQLRARIAAWPTDIT